MRKHTDIQKLIDRIRSKALSDQELVDLLGDERLLVVANVLMTLPSIPLTNARPVVDAVLKVAYGNQSHKVLLGTVSLRKLAALSLQAMQNEEAQQAFQDLVATFNQQERKDLQWLIETNQLQGGAIAPERSVNVEHKQQQQD
ncbi:MAG: hypothetical protein MI924_00480 [Chloroflexales bacterium]|nr:hypothetical protein [Chloroflexales bacterium]